MSGNFDFPPASSSSSSSPNPSNEFPTLPAHLERLQRTTAAHQRDREREPPNQHPAVWELEGGRMQLNPARRRRLSRRELENNSRRQPSLPSMPPSAPARPTINPSARFQNMRRQRQQQQAQERDLISRLDETSELGERLVRSSAELSQILDSHGPLYHSPSSLPSWPSQSEPDFSQRRPKRRKVDHDSSESYFQGFSYGHYGQVVPGRLQMEVHSCDGGEKVEDDNPLYPVQNVLRNDQSVYCTKHDRCDLILKHQADTVFHLDRLVIKSPEQGFPQPLQEGMIFVSMSADALKKGTSHYQVHYTSDREPRPARTSQPDERLSLLESLNDPEVQSYAEARRHAPRYARTTLRFGERFGEMNLRSNDPVRRTHDSQKHGPYWPTIAKASSREPPQRDFNVTIDAGAVGDDVEDESSPAVMADRLRRDARWRADSESEDEVFARRVHQQTSYSNIRSERRSTPLRVEVRDSRFNEEALAVLEPHARFFMQKKTSKITVTFDPPVAGKYILLKMWSPQQRGTIDVQCVMAHGFAGPRFFPACELR